MTGLQGTQVAHVSFPPVSRLAPRRLSELLWSTRAGAIRCTVQSEQHLALLGSCEAHLEAKPSALVLSQHGGGGAVSSGTRREGETTSPRVHRTKYQIASTGHLRNSPLFYSLPQQRPHTQLPSTVPLLQAFSYPTVRPQGLWERNHASGG